MLNRLSLLALLLAVLTATGCPDRHTALFNRLVESDLGMGITFTQTSAQVQDILGFPAATEEGQNGTRVTDFYISKDVMADSSSEEYPTDSDTPQLAVTFINGKLARVYNRWYPEDQAKPFPPYFMEPIADVKLGSRLSSFIDALGPATDPVSGTIWRLEHKDGEMIQIEATFTQMPDSEDQLCSSLSIAYIPSVQEYKGEEQERKDNWRKNVGL